MIAGWPPSRHLAGWPPPRSQSQSSDSEGRAATTVYVSVLDRPPLGHVVQVTEARSAWTAAERQSSVASQDAAWHRALNRGRSVGSRLCSCLVSLRACMRAGHHVPQEVVQTTVNASAPELSSNIASRGCAQFGLDLLFLAPLPAPCRTSHI
jgi:hypothetical protein